MEGSELALLLLAVAAWVGFALRRILTGPAWRRGTPASRNRPTTPSAFSYWYAMVPFEEGDGAKERPVLVLRLEGTTVRVLKVTSKAKPGRTNFRRLDTSHWDRPGQREGSWLQTDKVTTVPLVGFRRWLGHERNVHFRRELVRLHPTEFDPSDADPAGSSRT